MKKLFASILIFCSPLSVSGHENTVLRDYYLTGLVSQVSCRTDSMACDTMRAEDPTELTGQEILFLNILTDTMLSEREKYTQSDIVETIDTIATRYSHGVYFEPPPQDFNNEKLAADYSTAAFNFANAFINQKK